MTNHVPLDNNHHQDLTVAMRHGAAFGDAVNQMLVFPTEFEQAQRDFAIFFRRDDTHGFYAVVLLGLDRDENLFLGPDGWQTRYVPAVQRRGPFVMGPPARGEDDVPVLHVDLDDPRVGAADGTPLFLRHGGNAPYLEHVAAIFDTLRRGQDAVRPTFAMLEMLSLIRPITLEIKLDDGKSYVVPDLYTIDEERLSTLSGEALDRLHRSNVLRAAMMAAASIGNVDDLIARKNLKDGR